MRKMFRGLGSAAVIGLLLVPPVGCGGSAPAKPVQKKTVKKTPAPTGRGPRFRMTPKQQKEHQERLDGFAAMAQGKETKDGKPVEKKSP